MIRTVFLQPLGPALVLALGGLVLWLVSRLAWRYALIRRRPPATGFVLPLALLSVAAAAWLWLRIVASPTAQQLSWRWQPLTVAGATIHWRLEPWNGAVVLLLLILTAVVLLLEFGDTAAAVTRQPAGTLERTLWLAAAAIAFVCSANVLTVASCWLALDACILLRLSPDRQTEPAGRAWSLLALVAPLLLLVLALLGEAGLPSMLVGGRFGRTELSLLWFLGLIRVGVYPLHFWLTAPGSVNVAAQAAVQLLTPAAGIWFVARVHELAGGSLADQPEWAALGFLALLGSAMAAWLAEQPLWRWRWIAINRSSVILLAAYVLDPPGPATFVWPLMTFSLGSGLLAISLQGRSLPGLGRWPALLAALILWGAPGTVGFLARLALVFPTELALAVPLYAVVLVSEILLVAALWENMRVASGAGRQAGSVGAAETAAQPAGLIMVARIGVATVLLAAPAIVWGFDPQRLAGLAGFALPDPAHASLAGLIGTARRSIWIGLGLSAALGVPLGLWRRQIFGQMRGWQQIMSEIVSLEWLYRALVTALRWAGDGLRYFAVLGEGEGYLGWLALAGLVLWVLIRG